jgi:quercetin dioxygenase-like cupin family protein
MSIHRSAEFQYPSTDLTSYKDEPGTWVAVTRRILNSDGASKFEARYFEIAPGGYTSFEKHVHEHFVVVLRGEGQVRLGNEWSDIAHGDTVLVQELTPHQFRNPGEEPFGILCVVDRERDRPILLDSEGTPRTSE